MRTKLLMNAMWQEGVTPELAAKRLNISEEAFYRKAFGEEAGFTAEERRKLSKLLLLSDQERKYIFEEEA